MNMLSAQQQTHKKPSEAQQHLNNKTLPLGSATDAQTSCLAAYTLPLGYWTHEEPTGCNFWCGNSYMISMCLLLGTAEVHTWELVQLLVLQ